jgi:long-subunit acyl-CoA synthetase (AMP-forming)
MTELSFANHLPVFGEGDTKASGKLLANNQMKIVDMATGRLLGVIQSGEIYVKGPQRMIGYFNRPDATREAIDEDGFVKTGDVGMVDDSGQIFIVDRIKELIKVKGYQVAPAELEALLLTCDKIKDCAVFGVQHDKNGEAPKAFVVKADARLTEEEVVEYVRGKIRLI